MQERKVQEFVVVHGQILLNQFNNYPNEKVKKSAFAVALKDLMEMRRHCKLYQPKKKKSHRSTVINKNPMKVGVGKPKKKLCCCLLWLGISLPTKQINPSCFSVLHLVHC